MKVDESTLEGIPLLRISGDIDHSTAPGFQASIDRILDDGDNPGLLVDLTECPFIDSGGLNVLLRAAMRQQQSSRWLGVIGANPRLLRVFEVVGLTAKNDFRMFAEPGEVKTSRVGRRRR